MFAECANSDSIAAAKPCEAYWPSPLYSFTAIFPTTFAAASLLACFACFDFARWGVPPSTSIIESSATSARRLGAGIYIDASFQATSSAFPWRAWPNVRHRSWTPRVAVCLRLPLAAVWYSSTLSGNALTDCVNLMCRSMMRAATRFKFQLPQMKRQWVNLCALEALSVLIHQQRPWIPEATYRGACRWSCNDVGRARVTVFSRVQEKRVIAISGTSWCQKCRPLTWIGW
jgi:hypothetical protein